LDTENQDRDSSFRRWLVQNWPWALGLLAVLLALGFLRSHVIFYAVYFDRDKNTVGKLIEQFHDRMNAGQYDQIYDDANQAFKQSEDRESLLNVMKETRNQYGLFRSVLDSEMNVVGPPEQISATYNCLFEKGPATELFGFARQGHNLQLTSYQISAGTAKLQMRDDIEAAKRAADVLHNQMSTGDFDAIYEAMSDDLKATGSRLELWKFFTSLGVKLGNCEAGSLVKTDYTTNADGHFVGLTYSRKCEKGDLNERLAFKIVDGKALLRGFH
jgi:hypothetical protein